MMEMKREDLLEILKELTKEAPTVTTSKPDTKIRRKTKNNLKKYLPYKSRVYYKLEGAPAAQAIYLIQKYYGTMKDKLETGIYDGAGVILSNISGKRGINSNGVLISFLDEVI